MEYNLWWFLCCYFFIRTKTKTWRCAMQFLFFLNNVAQDSGLLLSFWRRAMYIFYFLQKTMNWFGILWKFLPKVLSIMEQGNRADLVASERHHVFLVSSFFSLWMEIKDKCRVSSQRCHLCPSVFILISRHYNKFSKTGKLRQWFTTVPFTVWSEKCTDILVFWDVLLHNKPKRAVCVGVWRSVYPFSALRDLAACPQNVISDCLLPLEYLLQCYWSQCNEYFQELCRIRGICNFLKWKWMF